MFLEKVKLQGISEMSLSCFWVDFDVIAVICIEISQEIRNKTVNITFCLLSTCASNKYFYLVWPTAPVVS